MCRFVLCDTSPPGWGVCSIVLSCIFHISNTCFFARRALNLVSTCSLERKQSRWKDKQVGRIYCFLAHGGSCDRFFHVWVSCWLLWTIYNVPQHGEGGRGWGRCVREGEGWLQWERWGCGREKWVGIKCASEGEGRTKEKKVTRRPRNIVLCVGEQMQMVSLYMNKF